ncbi:hypothetical protein F5Y00DRAFT_259150 [Daldinia vernicosa]|uniref:uncharacterized protein n=1 Tax=Daldinia vernicosa TaxID=114800 RepID=UPI002007228C|nr:uncharacterized protein F5Y00DRAFT_259150 [Daldinia vernicosa]KAI0851662.1 hypothetical protein F5Y00DRAFT_259150 [Daldinia vernicosa]
MKLSDARLDTFEGELNSMFLYHEPGTKTSVPGKRALRFERHVQVDTEYGNRIDGTVYAFFGAGDTGSKGVFEGFKNVVKASLSTILGDTSAGESYDKCLEMIMKTWNALQAIHPSPTVGRQAIDYPSLAVRSVGPVVGWQ